MSKTGMAGIAMMMASIMPEETLIEQLEEAIKEHKILNTKETRGKMTMYCNLICIKEVTEKEGLEKTLEDVERLGKLHDSLKTEKM